MVTVPRSIEGNRSWILEGVANEHRPVVPTRTLVSPFNGEIPVRLCNLTNSSVTMYKRTRIVNLERSSEAACVNPANTKSTEPVAGVTSVPKEE